MYGTMEGPDMNSVLPDSVSLGSSLEKRRSGGGVGARCGAASTTKELEVTGFTHELKLGGGFSLAVTQDAKSVAGDAPRDGREGQLWTGT